jgi:hypothetical protein
LGGNADHRPLMEGLLSRIKDLGAILAGAGTALYALGFLVARAHSRALVGTHPEFSLIDQAYVFAGIQFAAITAIALLVTAPLVIALGRIARWIASYLPESFRQTFRVICVLLLVCCTLGLLLTASAADGVFTCGTSSKPGFGFVRGAVLGHNDFGVLAVILGTGVTALTGMWLWENHALAGPTRLLPLVLVVTVALQAFLLPLQVGAYFFNPGIQMLAHAPNGTNDLTLPLWIVDRGSDRTVLLSRAGDGAIALVTVKNDTLDGIARTSSVISDILGSRELPCPAASLPP